MTITELQNTVLLEAVTLGLILVLIIAAFKRWKLIIYLSASIATLAAFSAWSLAIALGSLFVYAPASLLLSYELDQSPNKGEDQKRKMLRNISWVLLAVGVLLLICKNIYNIFRYLK